MRIEPKEFGNPHYHYSEIAIKLTSKKFRTSKNFITETLVIYVNGLREKNTIVTSDFEFEFYDDLYDNDIVEVEYLKKV